MSGTQYNEHSKLKLLCHQQPLGSFNKEKTKVSKICMNSLGKKSDLQPETSGLRGPQRHSGSASWQQCLEFPENSQNSL